MLKIVLILVAVYFILIACIHAIEHKSVFKNVSRNNYGDKEIIGNHQLLSFTTYDGTVLSAARFFPKQKRGTTLYFHGNSKNISHWQHYILPFTDLGQEVIMLDYRGFGLSEGSPSEKNIYSDAEEFYHWVTKTFAIEHLSLAGQSLGSAVASRLAEIVDHERLLLISPFHDIADVFRRRTWFLWSPFEFKNTFSNATHLENYHGPLFVVHGAKDKLVSIASAKKLLGYLGKEKELTIIRDAGHRDLQKKEAYYSFLKKALYDE